MFPVLIRIGPLAVPGYGAMLALGFVVGMSLAWWRAPRFGYSRERILDLMLVILLAAVVGARLLHSVIEHPEAFLRDPASLLRIWRGGVSFYGGLVAATLAGWAFARRHRIPFLPLADFLIPFVSLGTIFGRLGCFLAGCCYGVPTGLPWGLAATDPLSVSRPLGVALHPVQLYQVAWNVVTFAILWRRGPRRRFAGEVLLLFGMLYPAGRFVLDFVRAGAVRGELLGGGLSLSQTIGAAIFGLSAAAYAALARRARAPRRPGGA